MCTIEVVRCKCEKCNTILEITAYEFEKELAYPHLGKWICPHCWSSNTSKVNRTKVDVEAFK